MSDQGNFLLLSADELTGSPVLLLDEPDDAESSETPSRSGFNFRTSAYTSQNRINSAPWMLGGQRITSTPGTEQRPNTVADPGSSGGVSFEMLGATSEEDSGNRRASPPESFKLDESLILPEANATEARVLTPEQERFSKLISVRENSAVTENRNIDKAMAKFFKAKQKENPMENHVSNDVVDHWTTEQHSNRTERRRGVRFTRKHSEISEQDAEDAIDDMAKLDWNINIWESDVSMLDLNSHQQFGPFNDLVRVLTSGIVDTDYTSTFLLTFKSFVTPVIFLEKLLQIFNGPRNPPDDPEFQQHLTKVRVKSISILVQWMEGNFTDFDPMMIERVNQLVLMLRESGMKILADKLEQTTSSRFVGLVQKNRIDFGEAPPPPKIPKRGVELSVMTIDPREVARQITLGDWEHFSVMQPIEFLNNAWSKPKLKHRSKNVLRYISRFNDISLWVSNTILNEPFLKQRVKVFSKIIDIIARLFELNNFCGAVAMLSGLSRAAVFRMKLTREGVSKTKLAVLRRLELLMDSEGSFRSYRDALTNCIPPCIPHIGVFLTDLTFIEEGNKDMVSGPDTDEDIYINFTKRRMVYNIIISMQQFQQQPYNLHKVEIIDEWLEKVTEFGEYDMDEMDDLMYKRSLIIEPRGWDGVTPLPYEEDDVIPPPLVLTELARM
eukprot:TRINITY_DN9003_c0_g1_i1.p1 TRINITY_DN9003_c0_g1~~TRINITY_DN9003_c0_g1_i1.p1  ORF type:complete len:668 (+),score=168.04 TRINITY_DN9003_c0_g1_i1:74-2077(+)